MNQFEITGTTRLYCLLGYPAAHSASPMIHNTAFKALSLDCRYLAFEVPPEGLSDAVKGLAAMNAGGFNLTMPHKKAILPLLDTLTEDASLSGSVNTVIHQDGILTGATTDGIGYVRALRENGFDPTGKDIVILGGGGAAESIIVRLALEKASGITVLKRNNASFSETLHFAEKISQHTSCPIEVIPMEDQAEMRERLRKSALLVNATNVGMSPGEMVSLVPESDLFPELFVSDIIYHPRETKLLLDAKKAGCRVMGGLPMLLYQAAEAFRLWTGREMPVAKMPPELLKKI